MNESEVIKFVGQLYEVKSRKDGGSRIVLECGLDALDAIQQLQRLSARGDMNLAFACAPYGENQHNQRPPEIEVDENGEIKI